MSWGKIAKGVLGREPKSLSFHQRRVPNEVGFEVEGYRIGSSRGLQRTAFGRLSYLPERRCVFYIKHNLVESGRDSVDRSNTAQFY